MNNSPDRGGVSAAVAPDVSVEQVTVRYGDVTGIREVSLAAESGQMLAVTGQSGAGKTTLLWAVAGAVALSAGEVRIGDEPVTAHDAAVRLGVGMIPQGSALATVLTAYENIAMPLAATGIPAEEARERTARALASVGLEESGSHLAEELSGGQQQRVAVARTLALRPAVLLADEPTSELDHDNREMVLQLLRDQADRGATVVMATHDPEAAAECDHEVRLDEGVLTRVR